MRVNFFKKYSDLLKSKDNLNTWLIFSYVQQIIFLKFGYNYDWWSTTVFLDELKNGISPYDSERWNYLPFFPTRFFIDIPALEVSNIINLAFENVNFHRFVHMSFYFLVLVLIIKFCKDEINQKILKYWLIFPLFNFFHSFQHQHDSFVAMASILLINKIYNSDQRRNIIISIILLGYFISHKPIFAFIYLPILLSNIENFKKQLIVIVGSLNLLFYYLFFEFIGLYGVTFNLVDNVIPKVLGYRGFDNRPFFELIGYNFNPVYTRYFSSILFLISLIAITYLFIKLKISLDQLIVYYLLFFFIFSPTLATQNIAIIFIALSFFKDTNKIFRKYVYTIFEVFTFFYVIFYNIGRPPLDSTYFLAVAYNILFEFDILYFINLIPSEQYMNNFVAVALVFLFIKIYEDTVSLNSPK